MAEPITIDELMAELQRLGVPENRGDDGWTVNELKELWGLGTEVVRAQIRKGINAGIATTGKAYRDCIDGTRRKLPVYRFAVVGAQKKRKI